MNTRIIGCVAVLSAVVATCVTTSSLAVPSSVQASFVTSTGWVRPGETYFFKVNYVATDANAATLTVTLPPSAYFVSSSPPPVTSTASQATYTVPRQAGTIIVTARAATLVEDPEVMWKTISSTATLVADTVNLSSVTNGPHVTTLESARFGDRPFPVVNVQYADVGHCTAARSPFPECAADHPVSKLDEVINSKTSGKSIWQHYNDLSLGQLNPQGGVSAAGKTTVPFTGIGQHRFARFAPAGTCEGTTRAGPPQPQGAGVDGAGTGGTDGTPAYANRIENGWYVLPGTQGYYGSDKYGHGIGGALTGVGAVFGIDDGCGPTGKLAYDAASLADPDIDYNLYDTDRDGLVDFFEVLFAGCGGNGCLDATGVNNVWPHSSSLEFYFADANGQTGYVSNDQLRDLQERPLWWTSAARVAKTTTDMGNALKVYVRVGRYNVNPETAFDKSSVISHEYGHSLGLPDFYSLGSRGTFGTWELMAEDHSQYMTGYSRQKLGWLVPQSLPNGSTTMRESKFDTHSIKWQRPDGSQYELTGADVHNADIYTVKLPNKPLIQSVPDGTRAASSGAGNDFGCPTNGGHGLLISIPDLERHGDATAAVLKFKSMYEMEWDYDYGFVLASTDNGQTWTSLASKNSTTITGYNPNANSCLTTWGNGITGVSGDGTNTPANPDRAQGVYPVPKWIDDEFDLTSFKGKKLLLLLSYSTDPGVAKKGWFVDSLSVSVTKASGAVTLYSTSFEPGTQSQDDLRLGAVGSGGWSFLSTLDGGTADHAYYLEMRDRRSWDYQGKGQDDRANGPSWQAGLSMIYTNEATGYGNTDGIEPPHQTPVDAVPQPGNDDPNLNDAAFTLARPEFNGCTHIDNYTDPAGPNKRWQMPGGLKFTVTGLAGTGASDALPASPATATITAEINPPCELELLPPTLAISGGYTNPDPDGAYDLGWTRPPVAVGPDLLQEATLYVTAVSDDAESGLGKWTAAQETPFAPRWTTSNTKPGHAPNTAFWASPDEAGFGAATLTYKTAIDIPQGTGATLSFRDWYFNEGGDETNAPDRATVEVSPDNGPWQVVYDLSRPMGSLPDEGADAFANEPLARHTIDLSGFAGHTIRLRFKFFQGDLDYVFFVTYGWYVDDIQLSVDNFTDLLTTADTTAALTGKANGRYYYRVRTAYPAGAGATVPSDWSNVVSTIVDVSLPPVAVASAPVSVAEGSPVEMTGEDSSDPNGDPLTFAWSQQPAGDEPAVTLTGADTAKPSFTAPIVCTDVPLHFKLTVSDGTATADALLAVIVKNANTAPTADAGSDDTVREGQGYMLSAAGTSDPDCEALTYSWAQVGGPDVALANADTATPSFTAPLVTGDTPLVFRLTVSDVTGAAASDDVTILVRETGASGPDIGDNTVTGGGLPPPTVLLLAALAALRRRLG